MGARRGLRDQKKQQTRRALIEAALRLFDTQGYDNTTVAEIAAAATVSPATFFNYFAAKDEVVFADDPIYQDLTEEVFARRPDLGQPADLLLRGVRQLATAEVWSFALDDELSTIRARLIATVPALRAGALLRNAALQQQWARALHETYPDELNALHAAALTGALFGAIDAALHLDHSDTDEPLTEIVLRAATIALRGR